METEVGVVTDDWHSGRVRDLARQFDAGELLSTPPLSIRPDRSTPIRRQKRIITKSSPPSVNGHKTPRVFTSVSACTPNGKVNVGLSRKRSSLSKRSRSSHDSMVARRCQSQVNLSPPSAMLKSHSAHDRLMSTPAASPQHLDLPDFEPSPVFDDEGDETHPPYPLGERSYSSNILTIRLKPKTPPKPASLKAAFKCATLRPNFRPPPPPLAHRERKMAVGESHLDDDQKHLENGQNHLANGQNHVANGQANKENGWASTGNERSTEHVRDVSPSGSSRGLLRDCLETLDRDTSFASDSSTLSPFLQHRRASDDYVAYDSEFTRRAPADSEEQRDDSSGSNIYQSLASSPVTETYPDLPPPPLPPRNGPSTNGTLFNPSQVPPQLPLSPPPVPPKAFSLQRDRSTTDATAASSNGDYEDIEQISAAIRRHTQSDGWETTSNMSSLALDTPADFEGHSTSAVIFRQRSVSQESVNLKTVGRQPCASTSSAGCNGEKKKSKKLYRPQSTIDVDRLLRIKSDIQLNITKKVGQIKLKVTSATPVQSERTRGKSRYEKAKSMFYVESGLKTISHRDTSMVASIEFPLNTHGVGDDDDGEEGIYGDDWSSEDDDWASDREGEDEQTECGLDDQENVPSATGTLLPDVVPTFGDATATYASVSPRQSLHSNDGEDAPLPCNGVEEDEADLLSPLPPRQTSQETDENIDLSLQPLYMSRLSTMQPLYQIYMLQEAAIACSGRSVVDPPAVVPKATVQRQPSTASSDSGRGADCSTVSLSTCNTSMRTRERLVAASDFGSQRSLWCELPEVKSAGLLETLDEETRKLQEALFEVITSEASYLRSLNILITHFMAAPEMLGAKGQSSIIDNNERKHLFSNIFAVRDCSERLLCDLESRLEQNLVLDDVCDILCEHFEANFEPYIKYCSNQVYQDRTLRKLKTENNQFMSTLQRLEGDRQCQGLDMRSFLMLPMQRVTRYPLLVIAILDRVQTATERHKTSTRALHLANTVVGNCNEGARRMERTEQLLDIDRRLIYKNGDLRRIPLVSSGRYLIKHGQLTQICDRGGLRKSSLLASVHSKRRSRPIYLFLFSDLLMVTKKKVNGTYVAKDYCMRAFVEIEPMEPTSPKVSPTLLTALPLKPHLFTCTLMNNAKGKQSEMLLSAESESDRERWLSAMRPPTSANPEESVYPDWDCPQATTVHRYASAQDDELHLEIGEIVNVLRKMPDGWYFGERCRDGKAGWFPSSYVQEILNDHVRAKNYRQRLRMIQAAENLQHERTRSTSHMHDSSFVRPRPSPLMDRLRRLSNPKGIFQV